MHSSLPVDGFGSMMRRAYHSVLVTERGVPMRFRSSHRLVRPASTLVAALVVLLGVALPSLALAKVDKGDEPSYVATTIDGEEVTSESLRGKVVIVDFWATWCAPCRDSFPFYSKLVEEHADDLVVLAVSVDPDKKKVVEFFEGQDHRLTVVWHQKHPLAKSFGPATFPTSYVIDREGVVRHVHVGYDEDTGKETRAQVEQLLSE
jgi:cytochrome c biogenesis protein CcmG, thiol:disulfide interchange protein DsbE